MADSVIDRIDPKDTETLVFLYNSVFKPELDEAYFERRLRNRIATLVLVARIDNVAVGFFIGFELRPGVYFSWVTGVFPDARRMGIATQLMCAAAEWAKAEGYQTIRFECTNKHRPMLHFGIAQEYDIVGIRYDGELHENMLIFERSLV
ncbi:MAG: GNAT family N-acetyltransferase [Phycisphaeraceae bacterium]|nr:GNAT family N-acetyltransferase [Phycisphaeraceae bacterium]MCB9847964.1 GNAT family N-acetyltransferase [Phycisphaeraceae bacterium]